MTQLTASTYQARSRRAAHSFASCIRTLADQLVTVFFWGPQGVSWWQLRIVPSCQQPPNISKHCQYKTNTHAYLGHMLLLMLQADEGARPKPRKGILGLWRCIQVQAGCCHVRGQIDGGSMGIDGTHGYYSAWCLMDFYDRRWWERCVWKVCGWCSANV